MKKGYILSFILGIVLCGTVVVIADNLNASEIDYKETNVESALDTLYQRSTYTEYSGSTEITPSTTSQTLSTNNKLLKSNITINAIPSTFKELTQTTTVEAANLLSGETAYNSLGELITGNITTDCIRGSFTCNTCNTSTGYTVPGINFTINELLVLSKNNGQYLGIDYYNSIYGDLMLQYSTSNISTTQFPLSQYFNVNNQLSLKNWGVNSNATIYYIACR